MRFRPIISSLAVLAVLAFVPPSAEAGGTQRIRIPLRVSLTLVDGCEVGPSRPEAPDHGEPVRVECSHAMPRQFELATHPAPPAPADDAHPSPASPAGTPPPAPAHHETLVQEQDVTIVTVSF